MTNFRALSDLPDPTYDYLNLRTEESKIESKFIKNLVSLIERIQELNLDKSNYIMTQAETLQDSLANFQNLKICLNRVKSKDKIIEDSEDGTIQSVCLGLKARCDLEKEVELIKRKLEYQKFKKKIKAKCESIRIAHEKVEKLMLETEAVQAK